MFTHHKRTKHMLKHIHTRPLFDSYIYREISNAAVCEILITEVVSYCFQPTIGGTFTSSPVRNEFNFSMPIFTQKKNVCAMCY